MDLMGYMNCEGVYGNRLQKLQGWQVINLAFIEVEGMSFYNF